MTDCLARDVRTQRPRYVIRPLRDPAAIAERLHAERWFAAYALAQLEAHAFGFSEWWGCAAPEGESVVSHSRAGLGDALVAAGPPDGVAAILGLHPGAYQTFATCRPPHLTALEGVCHLASARIMLRKLVTRQTFEAVEGETVRLIGHQVRALNRLYGSEGGPTAYLPHHVDDGLYRGVVRDGRLVAVAGTHSISRSHSIAVVGNVFTHPHYRGRGYATVATSAVTGDLLEQCGEVVLSVDPSNSPAIAAYDRIGYVDVGEIVEAGARRRVGNLTTGLRRALARLRGRRGGTEVTYG